MEYFLDGLKTVQDLLLVFRTSPLGIIIQAIFGFITFLVVCLPDSWSGKFFSTSLSKPVSTLFATFLFILYPFPELSGSGLYGTLGAVAVLILGRIIPAIVNLPAKMVSAVKNFRPNQIFQ